MRWGGKIKIFPEIVPEMNVVCVFMQSVQVYTGKNYIHFVFEM